MHEEFTTLLEAELEGRLDAAGRERLAALCAGDARLAEQARQERRLSALLGRCGPNHAPADLARTVLARLDAEATPRPTIWRAPALRWGFGLAVLALVAVEAVTLTRQISSDSLLLKTDLTRMSWQENHKDFTLAKAPPAAEPSAGQFEQPIGGQSKTEISREETNKNERVIVQKETRPITPAEPLVESPAPPRARAFADIPSAEKPREVVPESRESHEGAPLPPEAKIFVSPGDTAAQGDLHQTVPQSAPTPRFFSGIRATDGTAKSTEKTPSPAPMTLQAPLSEPIQPPASSMPERPMESEPPREAPTERESPIELARVPSPAATAPSAPLSAPAFAPAPPAAVPPAPAPLARSEERLVAMRINLGPQDIGPAMEGGSRTERRDNGEGAAWRDLGQDLGGVPGAGLRSLTSPRADDRGGAREAERAPVLPPAREVLKSLAPRTESRRPAAEPSVRQKSGTLAQPVTRRQVESAVAQSGGRILNITPVNGARPAGREGHWRVRCAMTQSQLLDFMARLERLGVNRFDKASSRAGKAFYQVTDGQRLVAGTPAAGPAPATVDREEARSRHLRPHDRQDRAPKPSAPQTFEVQLDIE